MSRKKLLLVLGAVLAMTLAPTPGRAEIVVAPPFDDAYDYSSCDGFVLTTCRSAAEADVTGAFSLSAAMTAPGDGSLPGVGYAGGDVYFEKSRAIPKAVPAIELTITIHIDEAAVTRSGQSGLGNGYGYVDLWAGVSAESCFCYGDVSVLLADETISRSDEDLTLTLVLRNREGGAVRPGLAHLTVEIFGYGSLGGSFLAPLPNSGTMELGATGAITSVTARVLTS